MVGSYSEILGRIERKEAVVMTAQEVMNLAESGDEVGWRGWTWSPLPPGRS